MCMQGLSTLQNNHLKVMYGEKNTKQKQKQVDIEGGQYLQNGITK